VLIAWTIGEAVERSGLTADTLRYYERIGLLPPPGRSPGGRRIYRERDLARLRFIRHAQAVGFSLDEIRDLLRFREVRAGSGRAVRELAGRKHQAVREQMELLQRMESELALLISICTGDRDACPILERLEKS
jgi:DNA-binding transcriptional MerR regulator